MYWCFPLFLTKKCVYVDRSRKDEGAVCEEPELQLDEGIAGGGFRRCDDGEDRYIPRHRQTTRVGDRCRHYKQSLGSHGRGQ